VAPLYAADIVRTLEGSNPVHTVAFTAGEQHKNRESKAALEDELLRLGMGRDGLILALGGGVCIDLAGFVASTFMRGIDWLALPTSLLAMVDASVGGKTGINVPAGKNLVGNYHHPRAVIADVDWLKTLPSAELDNGLAEMVKHGAIADTQYLADLVAGAAAFQAGDLDLVGSLVRRSVQIKADVVAADPFEDDHRQVLNFGHTIAHAIELTSEFSIPHGRAVSLGMAVESLIAVRLGLLPEEERDQLCSALDALSLPAELPATLTASALLVATRLDKKGRAQRPRYALPDRIGSMARGPSGYGWGVADSVVLAALEEVRTCGA